MMDEYGYDDWLPVENPGEIHIPAVVVVDNSGSMNGQPMNELNQGLIDFKRALHNDALALGRADISLISFNNQAQVQVGFRPAAEYQPPVLQAGGMSAMNQALLMALNALEERKEIYKATGTKYFRPWLFLLTDGKATDSDYDFIAHQKMYEAIRSRKVVFMPMGIGNKASISELQSYYPPEFPNKMVLKANMDNFSQAFIWLSNSIGIIGRSDPVQQTAAQLDPLPEGIIPITIPLGL